MMEAIYFSEMSALTRAIQRNIAEDGILQLVRTLCIGCSWLKEERFDRLM
jgi:hypothetical protein